MATKLSSDLDSVLEALQTLQGKAKSEDAQLERWKDEAGKVKLFIGVVDYVSTVEQFVEAAAAEGVSVQEWAVEKLLEACAPNTDLPIDAGMYQRFRETAVGRGISLRELGTGVEFTEILREMFENRRM